MSVSFLRLICAFAAIWLAAATSQKCRCGYYCHDPVLHSLARGQLVPSLMHTEPEFVNTEVRPKSFLDKSKQQTTFTSENQQTSFDQPLFLRGGQPDLWSQAVPNNQRGKCT